MLFICYPNCSTCKKAQKWLDENQLSYTIRNIQTENPTFKELQIWHKQSTLPLKKFFNTSGQAYRTLNLKETLSTMSEEDQFILLSTDGMLVKRPLIVNKNQVLVGFKLPEWEKSLL